jgi:hypothetical protein
MLDRQAVLPYAGSDLAERAKDQLWLNFVDIDGTMTSSEDNPTEEEIRARREARRLLNARGPVVFMSARTPELMMSSALLCASREHGFTRPAPHWGYDGQGKRCYVPLESVRKFEACQDAEALCPFGSVTTLRHKSSYYVPDIERMNALADWRDEIVAFLRFIDRDDILPYLADIDDPRNYHAGEADVYPLEYRIQLQWIGGAALSQKQRAKRRIRYWQERLAREADTPWRALRDIHIVDESKPNDNPQAERSVIYLVPRRAKKEHMLDDILKKTVEEICVASQQFRLFVTDDTMTGLRAGILGGLNAKVEFLVPGRSRLTPYLKRGSPWRGKPFMGESTAWLTQAMKPTDRAGEYIVESRFGRPARTVTLADEAFPGLTGPESICEYLEYFRQSK